MDAPESYKVTDRPFNPTHTHRKTGRRAQMRADRDGTVLYDWESKLPSGAFINYNCTAKSERFHSEYVEL